MTLAQWLTAVADELGGYFDEEGNLLIPDPDFGATSHAYGELVQMYNTRMSPKEAADVRRGAMLT